MDIRLGLTFDDVLLVPQSPTFCRAPQTRARN